MTIIKRCSQQMEKFITSYTEPSDLETKEKYPFNTLDIGWSFMVEGRSLGKVQILARNAEIQYGKKFVVIEHGHKIFEVGRVNREAVTEEHFPIYEASPKGKKSVLTIHDDFGIDDKISTGRPWNRLGLGQCFIERLDVSAGRSLRVGAAVQNRKGGKKFKVIRHAEQGIFEVVRIY